jgi:hypothetical protein
MKPLSAIADELSQRDWYQREFDINAQNEGMDAPDGGNEYRRQLRSACADLDRIMAESPANPEWEAHLVKARAERDASWNAALLKVMRIEPRLTGEAA